MRRLPLRFRLLTLLLVGVMFAYSGAAWIHGSKLTAAPSQRLTQLTYHPTPTPLNWPGYGQAAVGAADYGLLATHNAQTPVPTASTIKIMTAYAVLKAKPLSLGQQTTPTLTMTQADIDIYNDFAGKGGSVALIANGEQLSEYQALQALLLPSANNIADSLVNWAFGSTANYLAYASTLASELGMDSTHIEDASGFSPQTVSTAQDMVRLTIAALKDPVLAQIVAQPSADIPVAGEVHNVNQLLGHDNIVGVKTGNTDQAGGCFVGAATQVVGSKTVTVITAIMGAPDLDRSLLDSQSLLGSAKANFSDVTVLPKDSTVGFYRPTWDSPAVRLQTAHAIDLVVWKGSSLTLDSGIRPAHASLPAHTAVGTVYIHGTGANASTAVITDTTLRSPSLFWRLRHPF